MIYLAKGVPFKIEKGHGNIVVWKNGKTYPLTRKQSIIWKMLYGNILKYEEIVTQVILKYAIPYSFRKEQIRQTLMQLESLDLLAYSEDEDKEKLLLSQQIQKIQKLEDKEKCFKTMDCHIPCHDVFSDLLIRTITYRNLLSLVKEAKMYVL